MNTEEELIEKVKSSMYDEEIITAINDPMSTPSVLLAAVKQTSSQNVLCSILDSKQLTVEVFNKIFELIKNKNYPDVEAKIIDSPFFTREMYNYCINDIFDEVIVKKLIESRYATEEAYLTILKKMTSTNTYLTLLSGSACTNNVMEKIISKNPSSEVIDGILKNPLLYSSLLLKIVEYCYENGLNTTMEKALTHPLMTTATLFNIIKTHSNFISIYSHAIVKSPACDKTILELLDPKYHSIEICNSKNATPEILIKVIKSIPESNDIKLLINRILENPAYNEEVALEIIERMKKNPSIYTSSDDQFIKMIEHPVCTEKILAGILMLNPSEAVEKKIIAHPLAGKSVSASVILKKGYLTDNDIDEFFSINGITSEDIINLITSHNSEKNLIRALDFPDIDIKLFKKIIDSYKYSNIKGFATKVLEKNPPEIVLVELIKKTNIEDVIKEIANHKNAGLLVVDAILVATDKFPNDKKESLIRLAYELKRKVIAQIYNIEKEENVTEILRKNIEDGLSTMLWGPSGVGKSSRVLEIDPKATMLILKNGMLPEEVIGGKEPNGEPGEIYPPHWYNILCEKCIKEPDKKHVLFIDEFTNVSDTIKNLVWEIIGNRLVNGHEEWPLPGNCSVVVAGNRPEESSAVRLDNTGGVMPAPLHNRIDSMLEIKFDIDEWQKWALETNPETGKLRIHPIVYSFCIAHADKVMFTEYKPDVVTSPFISPRKWETLSKAIYSAEDRGGELTHISDSRLMSILGENEISNSFLQHYERLPIDMNKIENGEYTENDFPSVEDKLYALGIIIAKYTGNEITIEDFIIECLGDEYLSIYKNMVNERKAVLEGISRTKK